MLLLQTSSEWVNINISVKYVFYDNILSAQLSEELFLSDFTRSEEAASSGTSLNTSYHCNQRFPENFMHQNSSRRFISALLPRISFHWEQFFYSSGLQSMKRTAAQSKIQWMIGFWLTLKMFKSANFDLRSSYIFLFNILVKLAATSEIYH